MTLIRDLLTEWERPVKQSTDRGGCRDQFAHADTHAAGSCLLQDCLYRRQPLLFPAVCHALWCPPMGDAALRQHRCNSTPQVRFTSGSSACHVSGKGKPVTHLGHLSASLLISKGKERRGNLPPHCLGHCLPFGGLSSSPCFAACHVEFYHLQQWNLSPSSCFIVIWGLLPCPL